MKITVAMLAEFLKNRILSIHLPDDMEGSFQVVQLLDDNYPSHQLKGGRVYISSLKNLPDLTNFPNNSVFITNNTTLPADFLPVILCRGDLTVLYEHVIHAFECYTQLDDTLNYGYRKNMDAEFFVNELANFFDNSVMLVDSTLNVIAHSGITEQCKNDEYWLSIVKHHKIPDYIIEDLLSNHKRAPFPPRNHAFIDDRIYPYPTISLNLFDEDLFLGRLVFIKNRSQAGSYVLDTLDAISPYLVSFLSRKVSKDSHRLSVSEYFWGEVISGNITNAKLIAEEIQKLGWTLTDSFVLLYLKMDEYPLESIVYRHMITNLESIFIDKLMFSYKHDIIVILRLKHYELKGIHAILNSRFADYTLKIGMSNMFSEFLMLPAFYSQARNATLLHKESSKKVLICSYNHYAVKHLIDNATQQELPITYIHPSIMDIQRYDATKNTEYMDTLRAYLEEERSLTKTAARLHVHKNTLSYRVEKINELFSLNLDNAQERLHLLISFLLLEKNQAL